MDASASASPGGAGNTGPTASRLLYATALVLLEPTRISLRSVGLMQVLLALFTLPAFNFFSNMAALCCGAILLRNFSNKRVMEAYVDADAGNDAVAGQAPPSSTRPFGAGARAPSLPEGSAVQLGLPAKPAASVRSGCCCKPGHANTLAVLTIFFGCFEIAGFAVAMWQVSGSLPQLLIYNLLAPIPAGAAFSSPLLWKYMNLALLVGTIAPILHVTLALVATTTYDSFRNATVEVRAQQAAATVLDARLVRTLGSKKSSKWASLTKTALLDKGLTTPRSILAAVQAVAAEELSGASGKGEDPEKAVSRILETVAAQRRADDHPAVPPTPSGKTSFASLLAAAKTQARTGTAALPRGRSMAPGADPHNASFMVPPTPLATANRARNGFDTGEGGGGRRGSLVGGRRGSVNAVRRDSGASATGAAAAAATRAGSFYDGGSSTGGGPSRRGARGRA